MPPKAKIPAPIDRPLSRAYLREFTGWSTAFPPGVSEPNSLREMENVMVNRDGSVRVRPGLRYLTYLDGKANPNGFDFVGTHETFYTADGRKAYLFAVREYDQGNRVNFRVAWKDPAPGSPPLTIKGLGDPESPFSIDTDPDELRLPASTTYVKYVQIDNRIVALSDGGGAPRVFEVGGTKRVFVPRSVDIERDDPDFWALAGLPDASWINGPQTGDVGVSGSSSGPDYLTNSTDAIFNYGVFFTFSTLFGESKASRTFLGKLQRPRYSWSWNAPESSGAPGTTEQDDPAVPEKAADQLVVLIPDGVRQQAAAAGATHVNVYYAEWSVQAPFPVEAMLADRVELDSSKGPLHPSQVGRITPEVRYADLMPWPTDSNQVNYTAPGAPSNGLVSGDRLIVVRDPHQSAVIRWTSNAAGEYLNFSAHKGGGLKTLATGNLYVPSCVKLWQNPESKDTITVLCQGTDDYSTSYYMAPAQVASQSDATNVMAFEETTATPGTVAPYGVEVLNNTLYHPLDDQLMKSTASNYNINHKSMTDNVANKWVSLQNKELIVSSQLDNRLYYLVRNPDSAILPGHRGNELWVLDTAAKTGTWSRWLVAGNALRKVELDGRVVMSVVTPAGIFALDENKHDDDMVWRGGSVEQHPIQWYIETNTQGANRAHDAWAHLRQVTLTLGNFRGAVRWGVRGYDLHGREILSEKITRYSPGTSDSPWDVDDHLMPRREMKEWVFFASSVKDEEDQTEPSQGQISLVQYRYTPVSVNVGYEYGSVETFEYGRTAVGEVSAYTTNGVPIPMVDTRLP